MIMVKLKMRAIYKTFLSLIGLLIILMLSLGALYLFGDKISEIDSDVEVTGNLSINYIDGKKFDVKDNEIIKLSVSNSSEKVIYYNINFDKVRGKGQYKLLLDKSVVAEGELKSSDEITTNYISIDANETKIFDLEITNVGNENISGLIGIRVQQAKKTTFADVIINNISISENSLTKEGLEIAVENEGLIKSSDDIGVTYYFRGAVDNNYVSFGDMTWRIVRINGDGTVRLVLDGITDVLSSYYASDNKDYNFENSSMKTYLEEWLDQNLEDYKNYIANSKFCNDVNYDDSYHFNSYDRIMVNKIPTFNCLGNVVNNNIGLLSIDEVVLAGATSADVNTNYYLYNSEINDSWYTITGVSGNENNLNLFMVDPNGNIRTDLTGDLYRNVRPVINLIKNVEIKGNGTKDNPYTIDLDKKID